MEFKKFWGEYYPYFVDIWQYLLIIVVFIIGGIILYFMD